tara:strand:+ start:107 stop:574 length:468 start_codon:yes stop_codon:yes gene_type:complete
MPDASDYIRTNQVGSQEDLEFTTAGGGPTIFIMRGSGEPSSSADTKAIVNYGYLVGNFVTRQQYFSGSQSSSLDSNSNPIYQVTLQSTGSQRINSDSLEVYLNGVSLRSNEVSNVHSSDYKLVSSTNIVVYTPTGSYGYNIKSDDKIKIKFQQGF